MGDRRKVADVALADGLTARNYPAMGGGAVEFECGKCGRRWVEWNVFDDDTRAANRHVLNCGGDE